MYRRTRLGVLAALLAVAVLAWPQVRADDKDADKGHHQHAFDACAKACNECQRQCDSCFKHCLALIAEGKKEHARTAQTCNDCGEVCAVAARVVSRQGPLSVSVCEGCAKACDVCGDACE